MLNLKERYNPHHNLETRDTLLPLNSFVNIRLNLIDLLTSDLSHNQKLLMLHLYNHAARPLSKEDIYAPIGITFHQWRQGLRQWLNGSTVSPDSHITGCGNSTPEGYQLLNEILYLPLHAATKITLLYISCRDKLQGWRWSKKDILTKLGIGDHTWRLHIRPELIAKGTLRIQFNKRTGKNRILFQRLSTDLNLKPVALQVIKYNITPSGGETVYNPKKPLFNPISAVITRAQRLGIKVQAVVSYIKRFTIDVVLVQLSRLEVAARTLSIRSPLGWLWNGCKHGWSNTWNPDSNPFDRPSFAPSAAQSPFPTPGVKETDKILDDIYRKPKRSSEEEQVAKQLADEARTQLADFFKKRKGGSPAPEPAQPRKKGTIPTIGELLGLKTMQHLFEGVTTG